MSRDTTRERPDLPPRVELRAARPIDRSEMAGLWERRLGFGIPSILDAVFDDERAAYGFVATEVETVVGFGVVSATSAGEVRELYDASLGALPETVALFEAGAVAEAWEGNGIGSALMTTRLRFVRDGLDLEAAVGSAWLRADHVDSSVLFERAGFERVATETGFFTGGSDPRDCPDCDGECSCSAAIYRWLDDSRR